MKKRLILILTFISAHVMGANRPYNDVLKEFNQKNCSQKKENIFLSSQDRTVIEKMSGVKLYGGLALRYTTSCPNKPLSYHYIDSHIVRTLNETVILTIRNEKLESFIVSSFNEPSEYKAPEKWYQKLNGIKGDKIIRVREEIDSLSGATLTVNASINALNKTMALHRYLIKK